MPADLKQMYEGIVAHCGGPENIVSLGCCMTRLRFTVKDEALVDATALRCVEGVAGYFYSGIQHQLIVGPFVSGKLVAYFNVRHRFEPLGGANGSNSIVLNPLDRAREAKAMVRRKYSGRFSRICARIGGIFLPLIPAYIACGLLTGIGNWLANTVWADNPNASALFGVFGGSIFFYLNAIVGYNANREFGGTPSLGVAFAGILNLPSLAGITLFGIPLVPGKGGVIAVLFVCWAGSLFEKTLRRLLKGSVDMFLTPTLTVLAVGFISLAVIQPAAGWMSEMLAVYTQAALHHGGIFAGAVLSGMFLPLVMIGLHQSLLPIHQQLTDVLGVNPLLPILCMAGAGQVGASVAVLFKTKNAQFKTLIKNALPVGVLGVGEPLIYGVTLPLFKPFIGACLGAAVGGAWVAAMHVVSSVPCGISGVLLLLGLHSLRDVLFYAVGYVVAVAAGCAFTWKLGFDDFPGKDTP